MLKLSQNGFLTSALRALVNMTQLRILLANKHFHLSHPFNVSWHFSVSNLIPITEKDTQLPKAYEKLS